MDHRAQVPKLKMTRPLRANWNRRIRSRAGGTISLLVLACGGGSLGLALAAAWAGLRFNDYVRTSSVSRSNLVVFCPAEPFAQLSVERGYRTRGNCPDGAEPLAKPIAARPGDIVELSATGTAVNGRLLPNTSPLATDTAGRPLSHWTFGRHVVARGTVWVASSYSSRSFDSRYFGPVKASQVREHVRPLLTAH
jgi:conjugative transfer signal peptidase TraF